MQKTYKKLRPWQGILLIIITSLIIFFVGPYLSMAAGLYGTLASEGLMLGMALLVVLLAKADFAEVFPIKKPSVAGIGGTVLLWFGAFMAIMIVDLVIMAFFPEGMGATNQGLNQAFSSIPFQAAFLIVAVSPAVCEEAVFRGVVVSSFKPAKNKWVIIVVSGLIFGAMHGDIFRLFPTAVLGMVMAYLVLETDNMIYNGLFHCINNALPLVISFAMKDVYANMDTSTAFEGSQIWMSVGLYTIMGAVIPFAIYIGNYLIHYKKPGYRTTLFPEGKHWIIGVLIIASIAFVVIGFAIMVIAMMQQPDLMNQMNEIMQQV